MSPLAELSTVVRTRRADMGLTQAALARLSGLSRATVNQLEAASLQGRGKSGGVRAIYYWVKDAP